MPGMHAVSAEQRERAIPEVQKSVNHQTALTQTWPNPGSQVKAAMGGANISGFGWAILGQWGIKSILNPGLLIRCL